MELEQNSVYEDNELQNESSWGRDDHDFGNSTLIEKIAGNRQCDDKFRIGEAGSSSMDTRIEDDSSAQD